MSKYISHGYKEDHIIFSSLDQSDNQMKATLVVENHYMPGDNQYHFTAFHTELMISQMLIIHGCLKLGLDEKPGEAYMRELHIKFKRQINKTSDIKLTINFSDIRIVGKDAFIRGEFSVEDNSFYGKISAVLPLKKEL